MIRRNGLNWKPLNNFQPSTCVMYFTWSFLTLQLQMEAGVDLKGFSLLKCVPQTPYCVHSFHSETCPFHDHPQTEINSFIVISGWLGIIHKCDFQGETGVTRGGRESRKMG